MKHIRNVIIAGSLAFVGLVGLAALPSSPASALNPADEITKGTTSAGASGQKPLEVRVRDVVNILLFIISAISVIMIILGGIRYVLSNGDSGQISSAKNTVLYAVIGLVIALLAYAIVNFIVVQFT